MFEIYIIIICLLLSMFFSAFEISLLDITPFNIIRVSHKKYFHWFYKKKEVILKTCLIGNNLMIVTATLSLGVIVVAQNSNIYQSIFIFFLELIFFFILAELLPKIIANRLGFIFFKYATPFIFIFYILFLPIILILNVISSTLLSLTPSKNSLVKREDFFNFLGANTKKQEISYRLMSLTQTKVNEIMTPFYNFYVLTQQSTVKEVLEVLNKSSFSRYPVVDEENHSLVIGFIEISDIYFLNLRKSIKKFIQPARFIPKYLSVADALMLMQKENLSIIFVVSELANVMGLITMKDLAEELVGEIRSKDQPSEQLISVVRGKEHEYILSGTLDIDDFNECFHLNIVKEDFETLSGYLMKMTLRIPEKNEVIKTPIGEFKVLKRTSYRISKILFITTDKEIALKDKYPQY